MRYSSRKLSNDKVITTACNFWRQVACSFQVMSGNILFLGSKIFEIPPFFQTRPGDLGKKVHACSLRFSALKVRARVIYLNQTDIRHQILGDVGVRVMHSRSGLKPPSCIFQVTSCLPIFNYGFSKGAGPMLRTKEENWLRMCSRLILKIVRNKERQLTSSEPWFVRYMKNSVPRRCLRSR